MPHPLWSPTPAVRTCCVAVLVDGRVLGRQLVRSALAQPYPAGGVGAGGSAEVAEPPVACDHLVGEVGHWRTLTCLCGFMPLSSCLSRFHCIAALRQPRMAWRH